MHALYPQGYNCGSECLINAVHTAAQNRTDLYPHSKDPGLDATIDAFQGVTHLKINYYVMVNLNGFKGLVNAVGGVTMDVKTRIAMFGHDDSWKNTYIEPGKQKLNGQQALWYARSRVQSDDYTRMGRQKCLMSAMLHQLSPQTVLLNAKAIAASSKELITTNLPAKELGQFADLALKARGEKVRTVSLVPPAVSTVAPDYVAIHRMIDEAIEKSERGPSPGASDPETAKPNETQSSANTTDDLASSC
jgi:LCP family protein required for cell wall assembly